MKMYNRTCNLQYPYVRCIKDKSSLPVQINTLNTNARTLNIVTRSQQQQCGIAFENVNLHFSNKYPPRIAIVQFFTNAWLKKKKGYCALNVICCPLRILCFDCCYVLHCFNAFLGSYTVCCLTTTLVLFVTLVILYQHQKPAVCAQLPHNTA